MSTNHVEGDLPSNFMATSPTREKSEAPTIESDGHGLLKQHLWLAFAGDRLVQK